MSASDVRLNDGFPGLNRSGRAGGERDVGEGYVGDVHDKDDARANSSLLKLREVVSPNY